jgi:limonene 1,2-monooxygenase
VAAGIERLLSFTNGGAGAVLFRSHEWATREQTLRSYELFARWVMPRFQGSLATLQTSRQWASDNRSGIFGPQMGALRKAFTDAGQEVPDHMRLRLHTGKSPIDD